MSLQIYHSDGKVASGSRSVSLVFETCLVYVPAYPLAITRIMRIIENKCNNLLFQIYIYISLSHTFCPLTGSKLHFTHLLFYLHSCSLLSHPNPHHNGTIHNLQPHPPLNPRPHPNHPLRHLHPNHLRHHHVPPPAQTSAKQQSHLGRRSSYARSCHACAKIFCWHNCNCR